MQNLEITIENETQAESVITQLANLRVLNGIDVNRDMLLLARPAHRYGVLVEAESTEFLKSMDPKTKMEFDEHMEFRKIRNPWKSVEFLEIVNSS